MLIPARRKVSRVLLLGAGMSEAQNVIALHGGEIPQTAIPRESVIEALLRALEAAQSGEVQAIALVTLHADGLASHTIAGIVGSYSLIGAAQVVVHKLAQHSSEDD
jgi:hypothetical protein